MNNSIRSESQGVWFADSNEGLSRAELRVALPDQCLQLARRMRFVVSAR
jgi:hypothetical protein